MTSRSPTLEGKINTAFEAVDEAYRRARDEAHRLVNGPAYRDTMKAVEALDKCLIILEKLE